MGQFCCHGHRNQVRIIGGQWRRRLLRFPMSVDLRPTPDRVRETLFNWVDCVGKTCLDLFAGSGALGFEAASRSAGKVFSVDIARDVVKALRTNSAILNAHVESFHIIEEDALKYLRDTLERFDLVFLDPPFASNLLELTLESLPPLLNTDALVYVECAQWPTQLGNWKIIKKDRAGLVHYGLLCLNTPYQAP